ncbi:MAG: sigma-54-dependent Fis family transcriptional regulator [Betaproteobacteria bacterium]|nr:sigma-54-dependent Fis family transcriptional regulator [Betaproteobacteria bacterium]
MSEILVVDDEAGIRELMREILEEEGYEVRLAENGVAARSERLAKEPALVLLDIWMPDVDGISLLREWSSEGLLTMPVVMMSGHGTIHTAVEATRMGAFDYLEKPVPYDHLLDTVARALKSRATVKAPACNLDGLGSSPAIQGLAQRLKQVAGVSAPLLVTAESGAGAEACARFLHVPDSPWFEPDNMVDLAERPIEWLNRAKGGLLFLREVADLTPLQQKGLLLLLSRRNEFQARIVCATAQNLAQKALDGAYSKDLYNALTQAAVRVPPLREHKEDIPALAEAELKRAVEEQGLPPRRFSAAALAALGQFNWPGNIDELHARVRSLAITALNEEIDLAEVGAQMGNDEAEEKAVADLNLDMPLKDAREIFERGYLEALLGACGGNMTRVAERSGLERTHLYRKLKQLGIQLPTKKEA